MSRPATLTPDAVQLALEQLTRSDRRLNEIIQQVGPFRLRRSTNRFQSLLRAIVAQQISTAAARSIWGRLEQLAVPHPLTAEAIHNLSDESLRGAGLSPQKLKYVRDLTEQVHRGDLNLRSLHFRSDDEIIAELTQIKGIGVWTAQMFLMFSLGRPDVLPHADFGIRTAIKRTYGLDELPSREECHEIAQPWRPYATVACWYLWRSLEFPSK